MVRACEEKMHRFPVRRCEKLAIVVIRRGIGKSKKSRGGVIKGDDIPKVYRAHDRR